MQFLGDAYLESFSSQQLDQLAEVELNGRQIKNVLRTAHLLARKQGVQLTYEHVQTILTLRMSN